MLQVVREFLCSIITSFIIFYGIYKISNTHIEFKNKKFWLIVLIHAINMTITFQIMDNGLNILRIFLNCIFVIIFSKILIKGRFIKIMLYSFFALFLLLFSEYLCMLLLVYGLKIDTLTLSEGFFGSFTTNIIISFIMFLLVNINKIKESFRKVFDEIYIKRNNILFCLILLTILVFALLIYSLYFNIPASYNILLNFILVIAFAFLALSSFHETNMNAKLTNEYEIVINELNDYEKMLKEKRKLLHNKENDLISIRGLINGKNKEALEYIDAALNDNYTEDINVLNSVKYIPFGGLQGLIYKKVLKMQDNKLNVILNVNKNIRKVKIEGDNGLHNKTICTIVGILLDNACEAAINSKQKIVNIQVYKEELEFVIKIENSYKGTGDMSRIDEQGYSTKGKDRGFGLDFVKEEVSKNKWLANERIINADIFTQIIKIKISNN